MANGDWTDNENDLIVADYFAMLADDSAGRPYNKAEHNRHLQHRIDRSRTSIEFKHQNISAVQGAIRRRQLGCSEISARRGCAASAPGSAAPTCWQPV
jgi:hypothetical protein